MKPALAQDTRGVFGAIPVTRENMRSAYNDFIIFSDFHLDAANRLPYVPGLDWSARIVQRTNRGSLREAIGLQDWNAEHQEKLLGLGRERSRAANECAKMRAEALLDLVENKFSSERQPQ